MKIRQLTQACLRISLPSPAEKRKRVLILVNPPQEDLKPSKERGDILIFTKPNQFALKLAGDAFLIDGPGEYEVKGVFLQGIGIEDEKNGVLTIYVIEGNGLRTCYFKGVGKSELSPEQLEKIGSIDVLLLPADKEQIPSRKKISGLISQIEPNLIVFIKSGKGKAASEKLGTILKEIGIKNFQEEEEIVIKKEELKEGGRVAMVLV